MSRAREVWLVPELAGGGESDRPLEARNDAAVRAARRLAAELALPWLVVTCGRQGGAGGSPTLPTALAGAGASGWLDLGLPGAGSAPPEIRAAALVAAAARRERTPAAICLPHGYESLDLLGRLAAAFDAVPVSEVVEVRTRAAVGQAEAADPAVRLRRPCYQGKLEAWIEVPAGERLVLTVATGFTEGGPTTAPLPPLEQARLELDAEVLQGVRARQVEGIEEADTDGSLGTAARLVSVGRGVASAKQIDPPRRPAAALGAELSASRPVVDAGWLPKDRQVGSSGQSVSPALYLALGISGASQHLQGIGGARCVVAVNKDPAAPIFRVARYGIVGDLHELIPALLAELE